MKAYRVDVERKSWVSFYVVAKSRDAAIEDAENLADVVPVDRWDNEPDDVMVWEAEDPKAIPGGALLWIGGDAGTWNVSGTGVFL